MLRGIGIWGIERISMILEVRGMAVDLGHKEKGVFDLGSWMWSCRLWVDLGTCF